MQFLEHFFDFIIVNNEKKIYLKINNFVTTAHKLETKDMIHMEQLGYLNEIVTIVFVQTLLYVYIMCVYTYN